MKQTYRIIKWEVDNTGIYYYVGQIKKRVYGESFIFKPIEKTKSRTYEDCLALVKMYHEDEKKEIQNGVGKEFTLD